jgi:hypothetical protein
MQRCKAKSKRSQQQCKNYALKGCIVCRMHGARGGPRTQKGLRACKMVPYKHGFYCKEMIAEMRSLRHLEKCVSLDYGKLPGHLTDCKICLGD